QFIDIRDIREPFHAMYQSANDARPGTGTGNALPEEVALVVSLRTHQTGRAHRGRVYLTGFDDSALDANGHAVPDLTANARTFVENVQDAMAASLLELAIGHRGHAEYVNHLGATVPAEAAGTAV